MACYEGHDFRQLRVAVPKQLAFLERRDGPLVHPQELPPFLNAGVKEITAEELRENGFCWKAVGFRRTMCLYAPDPEMQPVVQVTQFATFVAWVDTQRATERGATFRSKDDGRYHTTGINGGFNAYFLRHPRP